MLYGSLYLCQEFGRVFMVQTHIVFSLLCGLLCRSQGWYPTEKGYFSDQEPKYSNFSYRQLVERVNRDKEALVPSSEDVNLVSGLCLALYPGFLSTGKWPGKRFGNLHERGQRVIFEYHAASWLETNS